MSDLPLTMNAQYASQFAKLALSHVTREYPNKLDHVLLNETDVLGPRALHPIFYGSFDWHSCVHGYWLLCRIYRRFPSIPEASAIRNLVEAHVTAANVAVESAYAAHPSRGGFERPYGWAWLLQLCAELALHTTAEGQRWARTLAPLGAVFAQRFIEFLPKATYATYTGTHFNSAFAVVLATDYAIECDNMPLAIALRDAAERWFSANTSADTNAAWEPGGDDFLSPTLMQAECMRLVLEPERFAQWFEKFLPNILRKRPESLFTPVIVSDRTDGKIAHLDGLNLSRAWCWRNLADTWPEHDARRTHALTAASEHLRAALPHVAGDYAGEHWLATYAMLALDAGQGS